MKKRTQIILYELASSLIFYKPTESHSNKPKKSPKKATSWLKWLQMDNKIGWV